MRHARALTQKQTAALLGFKNLYSYQRLESPKSANPELATLAKIKSVFPDFDLGALIA
jgi:antitoxin HicB